MNSRLPIFLRVNVCNQCILTQLTYWAESWRITSKAEDLVKASRSEGGTNNRDVKRLQDGSI